MSLADLPPGSDLSQIPGGVPPYKIIPNFIDPPSLAHTVLGINITFMIIATVFVCCRITVNITKKRVAGIDDCKLAFAFKR